MPDLAELNAALLQYFGFDTFLEGQEEIIMAVAQGEDVLGVMPTGAGKSLCYQLPALLRPGYTLVISPLISLMKDQVDALLGKGIAAGFMNSSQSPAERRAVGDQIRAGVCKLLYVAPERLRAYEFRELVRAHPPQMLVVDEAHCISQWGHDFRPDYTRIGLCVDELQVKQVCGFTATATPVVREDIRKQLHRPQMRVHATGFKRPNLAFTTILCKRQEDKLRTLTELLKVPEPTIIYAATRANVELVAQHCGCQHYHAGLPDEQRAAVQEAFMNDECPVLVATNAFGMGIDRPDIRRVIHFNLPGSVEAFYQEAGRAGRDGEDAECYLLWAAQDRFVQEFFIELNNPPEFVVHATWQALRQLSLAADSPHLEITNDEIARAVQTGSRKVSETQISTVLRILSEHDYVERGRRATNLGRLRLDGTVADLVQRYPQPVNQRAVFVQAIARHFGEALAGGVDCTYAALASVSQLNDEQLRRVLRALAEDGLQWEPPFAGRGVTLIKPEAAQLEIDYTPYKERAALEQARLNEMISYAYTRRCRQQHLIEYFGQPAEGWRCERCDNCTGSQRATVDAGGAGASRSAGGAPVAPLMASSPSGGRAREAAPRPVAARADREQLEVAILRTVADMRGRFGRRAVAQVLAGSRSQEVVGKKLHKLSTYGKFSQRKVDDLLEEVDALMGRHWLKAAGERLRPTLRLTVEGEAVLARLGGAVPDDDDEADDAPAAPRSRTPRAPESPASAASMGHRAAPPPAKSTPPSVPAPRAAAPKATPATPATPPPRRIPATPSTPSLPPATTSTPPTSAAPPLDWEPAEWDTAPSEAEPDFDFDHALPAPPSAPSTPPAPPAAPLKPNAPSPVIRPPAASATASPPPPAKPELPNPFRRQAPVDDDDIIMHPRPAAPPRPPASAPAPAVPSMATPTPPPPRPAPPRPTPAPPPPRAQPGPVPTAPTTSPAPPAAALPESVVEARILRLRALRDRIAAQRGLPPAQVLPDDLIRRLVRAAPASLVAAEQLLHGTGTWDRGDLSRLVITLMNLQLQ